jgi:hypothetical protein
MLTCRTRTILAALALLVAPPGLLKADVIYDSLPGIPPGSNGQPGGVVSSSYFANEFSQWGDYIRFTPGSWALNSATVTMANYAPFSDWASDPRYSGNSTSWSHPITLNVYNVDHSGATPGVGSLIASSTTDATIPWHGNNGFDGTAFNVPFSFNNVAVPNEVIFGISYNTGLYGPNPIGTPGPYNFLNVAYGTVPPSVGTNVEEGVFVNAFGPSNNFTYTDPNAIYGIFQRDTGWNGDTPAIQFVGSPLAPGTPEPASLAVFAALGLTAVGLRRRKA